MAQDIASADERPSDSVAARADRLPKAAQLVGNSAALRGVQRLIEQVASFDDTNVLVLGESGTGKELVAQAVHALSSRRNKPFVPINCGAIPAELLESELFGHEKGAFTGALARRRGRFELAEGGTLFLDEIGDMPVAMQVKLLRVLQERSFERVGGTQTVACNVRVIAATHRNIENRIEEGLFREDLYYRLNVFPIEIPPLRERLADLPMLIEHFQTHNKARGVAQISFSPAALAALQGHDCPWSGNVRELGNLVERLAIIQEGRQVQIHDLPARYRQGSEHLVEAQQAPSADLLAAPVPFQASALPTLPVSGVNLKKYLADVEVSLVQQALLRSSGVVAHGAKLLGLRRTTLVEKMKKYGIDSSQK
ncbi:sigma-54 interaction domain-containing protein [Kineobactrum sediminis]|uniref:sigma-54 interaction domain-containing protein n=1 Tax=Kineobactrum sediminis TaxID=1905677 RepID=UPI001F4DF243|nr:sigma-54 dependent transcriptional regulator [Kineobactrum sediminis]